MQGSETLTELLEQAISYRNSVVHVVTRIVEDPNLAEDIYQDSFLKLIEHPEGYDPAKSKFKRWFFNLARGKALDYWKRASVKRLHHIDLENHAELYGDEVEKKELLEMLRSNIEKLPQKKGAVLLLHYCFEMPCQDIANIFGSGTDVIYWHINQAKEVIRKQLEGKIQAA